MNGMWKQGMMAAALALLLGNALPAGAESLTDALISAYKTSDLLEQNRAVLRAADEDVAIEVSSLKPVLSFLSQATFFSRNNTLVQRSVFGPRVQETSSLSGAMQISAELTLYDYGRTRFAIAAAKETVLATREALVNVEQRVLLQAVSAYMNLRSRVEFVVLRQRNVGVIERELRAAQDRFEVGEVTRTDVALAEARLAAARSNLAAAQGDLAVAREDYNAAIGHYPGNLAAPPPSPATAASVDAAKAIAQQTHPLIRQGQRSVTVADLNVARAQAGRGPTLTAGLSLGLDQDRAVSQQAQLSYRQTLYAGGQLVAVLRKARANAEAQRASLHNVVVGVQQDVGTAWAQLAVARAQIQASDLQIAAARIAFDGVKEEATLGARTTLDVLDAEQALLDAEVNRIVAENTRYVAVYSLLSAMGLMTVDHLKLGIPTYDPAVHYNAVKSAPAFSTQGEKLDRVLRTLGKN